MDVVNAWAYGVGDQVQSFLTRPGLLLAVVCWFGLLFAVIGFGWSLNWNVPKPARLSAALIGLATLTGQLWNLVSALSPPSQPASVSLLLGLVALHLGTTVALGYGVTWAVLWALVSSALYVYYRANRSSVFMPEPVSFGTFVRQADGSTTGILLSRPRRLLLAYCLAALGPFWLYVGLLDALQTTIWTAVLPAVPIALTLWLAASVVLFLASTYRANMRLLASRGGRNTLWLVRDNGTALPTMPGEAAFPSLFLSHNDSNPEPPAAA